MPKKYRYLLAFVFNPANNTSLFPEVYSLTKACSPDEVSIPRKTCFFAIVTAEVSTAKEFQSSFIGLNLGILSKISSSIPYTVENDKTFFFVGEKTTQKGIPGVYNSDTHSFIPLYCLEGMNYKVIDM